MDEPENQRDNRFGAATEKELTECGIVWAFGADRAFGLILIVGAMFGLKLFVWDVVQSASQHREHRLDIQVLGIICCYGLCLFGLHCLISSFISDGLWQRLATMKYSRPVITGIYLLLMTGVIPLLVWFSYQVGLYGYSLF